ncbi:GAF domain-containing protein [Sphingobacterium faecium]|uniref:GAF domain-containing protein n=1 Tax=Sphingobacterium faecium TaxID=34087 RepID=UPI002469217C|nr:GAF domain-containing protein [Sphingobacterium faecium]MDH5828074.1 GAF domain-containing protein [Sphingobacterium faecium]
MAEDLTINKGTKAEQYVNLVPQIKGLITGETNQIANLANIAAALKEQFDFFWVGFYLIEDDQLVLAPFQGPVACTRIQYGRGVCGTAWKENKTIIVPNVDEFPGHIACSSISKSEIVIPIYKNGNIIGILDVDSDELDAFDTIDAQYLTEIVSLLS